MAAGEACSALRRRRGGRDRASPGPQRRRLLPRGPDPARARPASPRPRCQSCLLPRPGGGGEAGGRGFGTCSLKRSARRARRRAGRRPAGRWRAEEGGPGPGWGGRGGRGGQGVCGVPVAAPAGRRGRGSWGSGLPWGARQSLAAELLCGLFQNTVPRFGEITLVIRVARSSLQRESDGQRQKLAVTVGSCSCTVFPFDFLVFARRGYF